MILRARNNNQRAGIPPPCLNILKGITMTTKYTIKTGDKIHTFKTLKMAREFARYIGGLVIIAQIKG
jgi:hypothetical protein